MFVKCDIWLFFENLSRRASTLREDLCTCVHIYPAEFRLEWETFQTKVVEKIKTHILCSFFLFSFFFFFRKSCSLWDSVGKCCIAREATDDNIFGRRKDVIFILDDYSKNTDTLVIFNTCSFIINCLMSQTVLLQYKNWENAQEPMVITISWVKVFI
jgi:hypothetical protein